jgi:hypothetical protein
VARLDGKRCFRRSKRLFIFMKLEQRTCAIGMCVGTGYLGNGSIELGQRPARIAVFQLHRTEIQAGAGMPRIQHERPLVMPSCRRFFPAGFEQDR